MLKIIYNANIHTMDRHNPIATALVIGGERIFAVGNKNKILRDFDYIKNRIDLNGFTIMPGLTDSHIHLKAYAQNLTNINCEVSSKEECLALVAERSKSTPPGGWILGHGWNHNEWDDGFGSALDLDHIAPNNPVYLTSKSLHASWTNTLGLEAASISINTSDPSGGVIQREQDGLPNGILLENAAHLVANAIPDPEPDDLMQMFLEAQNRLLEFGITGVHDFDGRICFSSLQKLHAENKLKFRVLKSIPLDELEHAISLGIRTGFGDNHLQIGSVKMFADGALGPHTASMLDPYNDDPGNLGILFMDAEEIKAKGKCAIKNGLSLAIHAIGDRANREVLNAYEDLKTYDPKLRHRIEHVQVLHPDDIYRLGELGIIASMQPIHATSDMRMANKYWGDRGVYSYAWKSQLDCRATLAFGSDAPVESPNPFWGIHAAVTRQKPESGSYRWYPEQCLSIYQAIQGYTTGASYAANRENLLGKIAHGYLADILVLDTDPFSSPEEEIYSIKPKSVMVGGEWVLREF